MLKIENITKIFEEGTINEKTVINDLSLNMKKGEFITVIGSNGAGKSTLINCIAGVFPPNKGKIYLEDKDITNLPEYKRARRIGRVFQDPLKGTAFDMTIEENLAIAFNRNRRMGFQKGISKNDREMFKDRLAELGIGLENRLHEKAKFLSGGQRQSLTLLMSVIASPKLLLLDEHTAALDPKAALNVLALTKKITEDANLTTLMITHNMKDALAYGTRTILLDRGKIIMDIQGEARKNMTVEKLIEKFEVKNDRMIL